MPKRRILLVDDEVTVLLTLKAVLEISGYDVDTAASAREGCTTNQPRRLLTSTMPRADSRAIASRTSVRLTPKTSASSCSPSRWPGATRPARMASTTWFAICGALEREGTDVVLKMR